MPNKLNFKVLRASGEDEKYKASELDNHGPSVRGWLSNRCCSYPQEVLFVLDNTAVLHQIQILAHHYIIPERIDVWIASDTCNYAEKEEIPFEYIGYITLSNNENTKFKCRELKTITIPFSGPTKYVKLSLYENHSNNLNVYNQVGLVAVQLIGEELNEVEQVEKEVNNESASESSQFDDLAFEMYVDLEIADLMKKLEQNKQKAVQDERFEYARKLKTAIAKLHQAGEKLGKMEVAKKQAIQQEDYSKAKKKKAQIEEFRTQINQSLNIENLLEKHGIVSSNDEEVDVEEETSSLLNRSLKDDNESNATDKDLSEVDSKKAKSPLNFNLALHNNIEQTPGVYESPVSPIHFGDSIVSPPAVNGGSRKISSSTTNRVTGSATKRGPRCPSTSRNNYNDNDRTYRPYQYHEVKDPSTNNVLSQIFLQSKLSEREKKQVTLAIHIFGKNLVEKIFSKQYADKEEGLRLLEISLKSYIDKEKEERRMADKTMYSFNKIARSCIHLCQRCLRDKVYAVHSTATEIIRFFFGEFITERVTSLEVSRCIEQILPDLLSKSGDSTPRVHNLAIHTILSLAEAPEVRKLHIIPNHLTRVLTANVHARLALSRLEMVEQLILSQGISSEKPSGMTCRILAELGLSGLNHPAEAVRKMAERILVLVYKSNPRFVRRQLPPDDEVTRRNILYRHLMQEFDKIDVERRKSESRPKSTSRDTLRSDTSDIDIAPKYSNCFDKALHQTKSEKKFKRCIFCNLESDLFNEKELNIHYWKFCPMLMRCIHCNQVIEIVALQEHLIDECDTKFLYRKCQECSQAVNVEQLNAHRTSVQCTLMNMKRACPLCFTELGDGEEDLRTHLTGTGAAICGKHPRSKYLLGSGAE